MGRTNRTLTTLLVVSLIVLCLICVNMIIKRESSPKKILLKGDLHCHSEYSHDGIYPIAEVAEYAKKAGFDFISITDHNTKNHFRDEYVDDTLIMIPGYELTLQRGVGHMNIFGVTDFKENIGMTKLEEIDEYVRYIQNIGGRVQINHPEDPKHYWGLGYDFNYNYYELWNGKFNAEEFKTLEFWQSELVKGNKIVATSGTDSHKTREDRYPVNCVYVDERSKSGILEALDKGNLYSTKSADGPHIKLYSGKSIMGDEVFFNDEEKIKIEIYDIDVPSNVRIYTVEGLAVEEKDIEGFLELEFRMKDVGFYRVEVWEDPNTMSAFSNPLYIVDDIRQ